jgi:hypothetical protein
MFSVFGPGIALHPKINVWIKGRNYYFGIKQ